MDRNEEMGAHGVHDPPEVPVHKPEVPVQSRELHVDRFRRIQPGNLQDRHS